jgi:HEAT repeat protein
VRVEVLKKLLCLGGLLVLICPSSAADEVSIGNNVNVLATSQDPSERLTAATKLEREMSHGSPDMGIVGYQSMLQMRPTPVVPPTTVSILLTICRSDPAPRLRTLCAKILGHLNPRDKDVEQTLLKVANSDASLEPRLAATTALGEIGIQQSTQARTGTIELLSVILDKNDNNMVRGAAAQCLGWLAEGNASVVPVLKRAMNDDSLEVRKQAMKALHDTSGAVSADLLPSLIKSLDDPAIQYETIYAISHMGASGAPAVPALTKLVEEQKHGADAAYALMCIGSAAAPAVPALVSALNNKDFSAASSAEALSCIGGAQAKAAIPSIVPLLNSSDDRIRRSAAHALGKFGPDAAVTIPDLKKAYEHEPQWYVCDEMASALNKITGTNDYSRNKRAPK